MNPALELIDRAYELLDVLNTLRDDVGDLDDVWESSLIDSRKDSGAYQFLQRAAHRLEDYIQELENDPNVLPTLLRRDI